MVNSCGKVTRTNQWSAVLARNKRCQLEADANCKEIRKYTTIGYILYSKQQATHKNVCEMEPGSMVRNREGLGFVEFY